jgi:hypothetical protein
MTVAISGRFLLARDVNMISTTIAISSLQQMRRQNSKLLQEQTNKEKKTYSVELFHQQGGVTMMMHIHTYLLKLLAMIE